MSDRADVLGRDQDIDLFEKPLKMFLVSPEKPFSLPISAGDDFNLDNIVDKIHTAILPTSLIGSRLGTDSERAKNSDQLFTNLFDLLSFDLRAIVIFQWQVDLILFSCSERRLRQGYAAGRQFFKRNPLPLKDFYMLWGYSINVVRQTTHRCPAPC